MLRILMLAVQEIPKNSDGATMIEYSVLVGLITAVILLLVTSIANWMTTQWTNLNSALA